MSAPVIVNGVAWYCVDMDIQRRGIKNYVREREIELEGIIHKIHINRNYENMLQSHVATSPK